MIAEKQGSEAKPGSQASYCGDREGEGRKSSIVNRESKDQGRDVYPEMNTDEFKFF